MEFIKFFGGRALITLFVMLLFGVVCTFPAQSLAFVVAVLWLNWVMNGWANRESNK